MSVSTVMNEEIFNIIRSLVSSYVEAELNIDEKCLKINFGLFICQVENPGYHEQLIISCDFNKNSIEYKRINGR